MYKRLRADIPIAVGMLITCIMSGCGEEDSPEKAVDPPQSNADIPLPSAVTVMVDPEPNGLSIGPYTEFTLVFSKVVWAVKVNGKRATGSLRDWKVTPGLKIGVATLNIEWKNVDNSSASTTVGPYEVPDTGDPNPPKFTVATVIDGLVDVDPFPINAGGFWFDFDEQVTGTIKLTDEAGNDLSWTGHVAGTSARLSPIVGRELLNETTYKIEFDLRDVVGYRTQWTITFVTKSK